MRYGDLTELNKDGMLLTAVGPSLLQQVTAPYLDLLQTSSAIYERNGDYAMGIFSSKWCTFLDNASRNLAGTLDNAEALQSGKWHCHESCWKVSKEAMERGKPQDRACAGGIHIYACPIMSGDEVVGAINFGYGAPPRDSETIQRIAAVYKVDPNELAEYAQAYTPRPTEVIDSARKQLQTSAMLLGEIVRRHAVEQQLTQSTLKYKGIFETAPNLITSVDEQGIIVECNSCVEKVLGYHREEIIGASMEKIIHPDFHQKARASLAEIRSKGSSYDKEYRMVKKDGALIDVTINSRGLKAPDGRFTRTICVIEDITERKRAEADKEEQRNFLKTIIDMSPFAMWVADRQGTVIKTNRTLRETINLSDDAIIGKYNVLGDENLKAGGVMPLVKDVFHKHIPARFTIPWKVEQAGDVDFSGGRNMYIDVSMYPILDMEGGLRNVVCQWIDISEQKQAQLDLIAERERLAVTLRSIGDGVITTDTHGRVVLMNREAETLTGWSLEEAQGRLLGEVFIIVNEISRETCENPVDKVLSSGEVIELANHTLLIARDGAERVIADSGAPIKDNEGSIIGVVLVFRDTTEKQRMQDAMQRAARLESLGILAGGIAHDFNNLLGGIYGFMDMAGDESSEPEVREYIQRSMATIDRARSLTSQLLTFSRGGTPVKKVAHLFPFVKETAKFALSGSTVSPVFDIQSDLWSCDFDQNQLGQVIDNLVINAQQAMPLGGEIRISAANVTVKAAKHQTLPAGGYVKLSIEDQGIGIPHDLQDKIFDPFFSTKTKGHGLGLATCFSIIDRHGGSIDVDSAPGEGSVFHVYLPAAGHRDTTGLVKPVLRHRGKGTIIVMDDEAVMRDITRHILESFGYSVVCTTTGREAIDALQKEIRGHRSVRAMILDLTIPGAMGGKEAVGEIRTIDPTLPVFVASGYSEDPIMANPSKYDFTASIPKPFRKAELAEVFEKYLKMME
ncbi:MAG: PAS domain S-box protein [Chitinivibrionales bacterium]|nr:PAS domain S-box protein [Chitinivibrionales bacterium]